MKQPRRKRYGTRPADVGYMFILWAIILATKFAIAAFLVFVLLK